MPSEKKTYSPRQKFLQLYEILKKDIQDGVYKNDQKIPTEVELATQYKLSRPTVAKALDLLRKEGMIERTSGIGTFVQMQPRNEMLNFGLLIPGLGETEIFESICGHMSKLAQTKKFNLIWSGSIQDDAKARKEHIESLAKHYIEQKVDGVFFTPLELTSEKDTVNESIVKLFDQANIPLVLMDRDIVSFPSRSEYDLVSVDNFRLTYIITQHMIEQGCRTIKFVARPFSAPSVQMRIYGYTQALLDAGLKFTPDMVSIEDNFNSEYIKNLLSDCAAPAIICANDTTASKFMHALTDTGFDIPNEVKVAGVDDIKYANYLRVPLTTYKQPCKEIAEIAIELMFSRIKLKSLPARTIFLEGKLITRKSTAC